MGSLSIVMPVFNEEATLPALYERLCAVSDPLTLWTTEFLFVDDGSDDGSGALIRSWMLRDPRVRLISLSRNFGHQTAITCGLDATEADVVVTMDADLQDPPEVIPRLLESWSTGSMVVYARRRTRNDESYFKRASAAAFYRLINLLSDVEIPCDVGDFRLLDRRVVLELRKLRESSRYVRGMVAWVGFRHDFVDYDRDGRAAGSTAYTMRRMLRLAADGLTSFSDTPLRLVRWLGFAITGLAFALLAYTMVGKLVQPSGSVPGYATLVGVVTLGCGVQMLSLGVIGDYVGRAYRQVKGRPLYVVAEDARGFTLPTPSHEAGLLCPVPADAP